MLYETPRGVAWPGKEASNYKKITTPPPRKGGGGVMVSGPPSVRPSVVCPLTHISRDEMSLKRRGISIKLATNIHHVSWNCRTGFQGHRSAVKVICGQMCECCYGAEAYSTF